MSSSASEVVSTTTGMVRSSGSALTSSSTSRPSLRGRLRSSRIRSGRGASAKSPSRRRKAQRLDAVSDALAGGCASCCRSNASSVISVSPGSSSTRRTSIGLSGVSVRDHGADRSSMTGNVKRKVVPVRAEVSNPDAAAVALDDLACTSPGRCRCPGRPRWWCSRWKITKMRSAYSGSMPMPLSRTENAHGRRPSLGRHVDRGGSLAAELERVADQVLEDLRQQRRLAQDRGQRIVRDPAPASSIGRRRLRQGASPQASSRSTGRAASPSRPTRENASRSLISCCIRLAPSTANSMYWSARVVELAAVAALQELQKLRHLAQRLLQVVGGDVGELLQLGVGAAQIERLLVEEHMVVQPGSVAYCWTTPSLPFSRLL